MQNGEYNHGPLCLQGHAFVRQLQPAKKDMTPQMNGTSVPPKNILIAFCERNPTSWIIKCTIYNEHQKLHKIALDGYALIVSFIDTF